MSVSTLRSYPTKGPGLHTAILLIYEENGKLVLNEEGAKILESFKEDLAVIGIAGPARTGKSSMACLFVSNPKAFVIGHSSNTCTHGIWFYSELILVDGKYHLFLDVEGSRSIDQKKDSDMRLYTITVLLTSTFIFNKLSTIDSTSLQELSFVSEIVSNLKIACKDGEETTDRLAQFFPNFILLARDFHFDILDSDNRDPITPKQYLENTLTKNSYGDLFKKCFLSRDLIALPAAAITRDLRRLDSLGFKAMDWEFVEKVNDLREKVFTESHIFRMNKPSGGDIVGVNGRDWVLLLRGYLNFANENLRFDMDESFKEFCRKSCYKAHNAAIEHYKTNMVIGDTSVESTVLYDMHANLIQQSLDIYRNNAKGDSETFEEFLKKLQDDIAVFEEDDGDNFVTPIAGLFHSIYFKNYKMSRNLCSGLQRELLTTFHRRFAEIQTKEELSSATEDIIRSYFERARGPCVGEFIELIQKEIDYRTDFLLQQHKIDQLEAKSIVDATNSRMEALVLQRQLDEQEARAEAERRRSELEYRAQEERHGKAVAALNDVLNQLKKKMEEERVESQRLAKEFERGRAEHEEQMRKLKEQQVSPPARRRRSSPWKILGAAAIGLIPKFFGF